MLLQFFSKMEGTDVEHDIPEALAILKEIKKSCGECLQHIRALTTKVHENPKSSHVSSEMYLINFSNIANTYCYK